MTNSGEKFLKILTSSQVVEGVDAQNDRLTEFRDIVIRTGIYAVSQKISQSGHLAPRDVTSKIARPRHTE